MPWSKYQADDQKKIMKKKGVCTVFQKIFPITPMNSYEEAVLW